MCLIAGFAYPVHLFRIKKHADAIAVIVSTMISVGIFLLLLSIAVEQIFGNIDERMQKIHLSTTINAPVKKVWDTMLQDATYRDWTGAFNPGSYYVGSWEKGADIRFLGPSPDGKGGEGGMISRIAENKPYAFVSIEHLGFVMDGKEDFTSDMVKAWKGAHENYTFTEKDGGTELVIDLDISESEKETMEAMWKKALARLKELAEA